MKNLKLNVCHLHAANLTDVTQIHTDIKCVYCVRPNRN